MLTKCGEFPVPEEHLAPCHTCDKTGRSCSQESQGGPGEQGVDFLLYVSAVMTPQCLEAVGREAETVAYAAHCQQEESLDRPVAGHTNICPESIKNNVRTVLSSIGHLLHRVFFYSRRELFKVWSLH